MQPLLYQNKYRIKSSRRAGYDYSQDGWYYVTICTKDKQKFFGNIVGDEMVLNDVGGLAEKYCLEIPEHFDNVRLDEYVIMPNHIHGIIVIASGDDYVVETPNLGVSTTGAGKSHKSGGHNSEWKPGTLGVIINQYKRKCTIEIRKINSDFAWQSRFHDHIIRNDKSLNKIRKYITENPLKWYLDQNYVP